MTSFARILLKAKYLTSHCLYYRLYASFCQCDIKNSGQAKAIIVKILALCANCKQNLTNRSFSFFNEQNKFFRHYEFYNPHLLDYCRYNRPYNRDIYQS